MVCHESAIIAIMISFPLAFGLMFQAHEAQAQDFSMWGGAYGYASVDNNHFVEEY
jgi:hypothetical protein